MIHQELLRELAKLKLYARITITYLKHIKSGIPELEKFSGYLASIDQTDEAERAEKDLETLREIVLNAEFSIIEYGQYLYTLCKQIDEAGVPITHVLNVLGTNISDQSGELIEKYGYRSINLIAVLDLENSATKDDGIEIKPLKWCQTIAFMHELQTNSKLDRIVHDECNNIFNGAFGDYKERPLIERMTGARI